MTQRSPEGAVLVGHMVKHADGSDPFAPGSIELVSVWECPACKSLLIDPIAHLAGVEETGLHFKCVIP